MDTKFDYIVIGSGPAGHASAIKAAELGLKTIVVEKDEDMFGGVCLNEGCIPAKSIFHSASVASGAGKVDMEGILAKSRQDTLHLKKGLKYLFEKNKISLIKGTAQFVDKNTVRVDTGKGAGTELKADKILIATGSEPRPLPELPFDGKLALSSSHAIRLNKIPETVLVIGGGAIGSEFASYFALLGSRVTIAEVEEQLLPSQDSEIARRFQSIFSHRGINVMTGIRIKNIRTEGEKVTAIMENAEGETTETFDTVLVSVGRKPSTAGLGLEKAGIKTDAQGFIPVDAAMRTSAGNIFAAGDVIRTPMLAHAAFAEGDVAAEAAAGRNPEPVDYSAVPYAVYTDTEVASVGMTEDEAKEKGLACKAGKHFFKANGRAVASGSTEGFVKVLADTSTRKILGAHIIGHMASELIHEFVIAKKAGLTVDALAKTVHAHPTFSEAAADACKAV